MENIQYTSRKGHIVKSCIFIKINPEYFESLLGWKPFFLLGILFTSFMRLAARSAVTVLVLKNLLNLVSEMPRCTAAYSRATGFVE